MLCWQSSWKTAHGGHLGPTVGLKTPQTQTLLEADSHGSLGNSDFPRGPHAPLC